MWKGEDGKIYAAMGPLIKVGEGDPVKIEVSWSHPDPLLSRRNFEIKIGTPQTSESTLTVDRPFMGTVSKYDQDYGPSAPSIFRKWEMSQVWEARGQRPSTELRRRRGTDAETIRRDSSRHRRGDTVGGDAIRHRRGA